MELPTPWHLILIILAFVLLFGYQRLPDASRSIGRSLRIFASEMRGAADDGNAGRTAASPSPAELEAEARAAEAKAAELRARVRSREPGAGPDGTARRAVENP